mmetsp:Transcript_50297/g.162854  ORF Transcript_50297/g.162854 Transcript_50297/m.162854 type:complete len:238 (+) Transcript_50297:1719-2432(+)
MFNQGLDGDGPVLVLDLVEQCVQGLLFELVAGISRAVGRTCGFASRSAGIEQAKQQPFDILARDRAAPREAAVLLEEHRALLLHEGRVVDDVLHLNGAAIVAVQALQNTADARLVELCASGWTARTTFGKPPLRAGCGGVPGRRAPELRGVDPRADAVRTSGGRLRGSAQRAGPGGPGRCGGRQRAEGAVVGQLVVLAGGRRPGSRPPIHRRPPRGVRGLGGDAGRYRALSAASLRR